MLYLEIKCKTCGQVRQLQGINGEEIVRMIDKIGWLDLPESSPKGVMMGYCVICREDHGEE